MKNSKWFVLVLLIIAALCGCSKLARGEQDEYMIDFLGGILDIPVQYNSDYDLQLVDDAGSWISIIRTKTLMQTGGIQLDIATNFNGTDRYGQIIARSKENASSVTITIHQRRLDIAIPPSNEIWYKSHSGKTIPLAKSSSLLVSNTYVDGKGIYRFSQDLTDIGEMLDYSDQCQTTRENEDFKSLILPKGVTSITMYGLSHFNHAVMLVLPYNLSSLSADCFCRFGEKTNTDNHLFFLSPRCPTTSSVTFWNQHGKLFVHYPKGADYSEVESALQWWAEDIDSNDWVYSMVETDYDGIMH